MTTQRGWHELQSAHHHFTAARWDRAASPAVLHRLLRAGGGRTRRPLGRSKTVGALVLLAGTFAAVSPWVVGFAEQVPLTATDAIVGLVIVLAAVGRTSDSPLTWVCGVLGGWLILAPWLIHQVERTTPVLATNTTIGVLIVILAVIANLSKPPPAAV